MTLIYQPLLNFAPNLHSLILSKNYKLNLSKEIDQKLLRKVERVIPSIKDKDLRILKYLERLVLHDIPLSVPFISSQDLLTLLSFSSLSYVELQYCDTLTDEILQRANNLH